MEWIRLLSSKRLGVPEPNPPELGRSVFQRDYDAIVFASAFRRLQDKTQVFPVAKSDYVRTRLTHSLEASCVGRSLGKLVADALESDGELPENMTTVDVGTIVASACLAHDLGNPPFGHTGEKAIQEWFASRNGRKAVSRLRREHKADCLQFEGNAQGFRILTKLQNPDNPGGLQLTYATLAAFTKYPRPSYVSCRASDAHSAGFKKHGYFYDGQEYFDQVAREVGLAKSHSKCGGWSRHPLSFLVEGADDICYGINDVEDGYRLNHVSFDDAVGLLRSIPRKKESSQFDSIREKEDKIAYLRAKAIRELIFQVSDCFNRYRHKIMSGAFKESLIDRISSSEDMKRIQSFSRENIYTVRDVLEVEVPGFDVLAR
ncbi:dGTP triphosphohydrolase [Candidatus Nitrospira bockiana]